MGEPMRSQIANKSVLKPKQGVRFILQTSLKTFFINFQTDPNHNKPKPNQASCKTQENPDQHLDSRASKIPPFCGFGGVFNMGEKKRSGEKKGGVKLGGLGGGGGLVVVGGALVAATVWSFCEFRRRRRRTKPSCKKGTLKGFHPPNLEKVESVDEGSGGLRLILQNPNLPVDVHESEAVEKDSSGESDASALKLLLEGEKIEDDGSILSREEDAVITCEVVHEIKQEAVEFWDDSMDGEALSSASEDEAGSSSLVEESDEGIMLEEKTSMTRFAAPESIADDGIGYEKKGDDEVVESLIPVCLVDDGCKDVVSEDPGYQGEDGNEGSPRRTADSAPQSYVEAVRPMESLEDISHSIKYEKYLEAIPNEIVELDSRNIRTPTSTDHGNYSIVDHIHHNKIYDENVSCIYEEGSGSSTKYQMVGNSTRTRIWASTVLLALLVLLGALLAQRRDLSPVLTDSLSSISAFLMKLKI